MTQTAVETRLRGRRRSGSARAWSPSTVVLPLITLAVFLAAWDIATRLELVEDFLLPTPWAILSQLREYVVEIVTGGEMATHFLVTLNEIVVGFVISVVLGVIIAVAMSEFRFFRDGLYPYIVAIDSTPKVAVAPLFVIWFGFGQSSKIFMVVSIAIFPVIITTLAGLKATNANTLRLMRSLGASRWELLRKVRLRNAMPYFFAGLEIAIAGASVGAVVGEFTAGNQGLGYVTLHAQEMFNLEAAFAAIVLLAVQGIVLHRVVVIARRRIVFWDTTGRKR